MALISGINAYWKLDGNSNDSVGSLNGTDTSISYSNSYGIINQGAYNSSTGGILFPSNAALDITNNFTISFWMKRDSSLVNAYILSKRNAALTDNIWSVVYSFTSDKVAFYCNADRTGSDPYSLSQLTISDENWHHVVYTYDGTDFKGYLDNSLVVNTAISFSLGTASTGLQVFSLNGAAYFFTGKLDEIGIWGTAKDATEVSQLYNAGLGFQYPFSTANTTNFFKFF